MSNIIERRFFTRISIDEESPFDDPCWLWTGAKCGQYGQFYVGYKVYAHIWSYQHFVGPVPAGKEIHHRCVNKLCVNWRHLTVKTRREHVHEHRLGASIDL